MVTLSWQPACALQAATPLAGADLTGRFVRDSQRLALSSTLLLNFTNSTVSEQEIPKLSPTETVTQEVRHTGPEARTQVEPLLGSDPFGLRLQPRYGRAWETTEG